jgi:iron complex outermembrane receptor protein
MRSILLLLYILIVTNIYAVDSLEVRKLFKIDGITVIAESPRQTIGAIDTKYYDTDDIQRDITIADAISDMSGLFLSVGGKGESNIRMRGFEKHHIKFFIDGRPITDGYFGNLDLHLLPLANISRINVIKGPVSSLFGFNTMGGAINIITEPQTAKNSLKLNSSFTYPNTYNNRLAWSHRFNKLHTLLSVTHYITDGYYLPRKLKLYDDNSEIEPGSKRTNSARERYDISLRLRTELFRMHSLQLNSGYSYMPEKGNPPSIYPHADDRYSKIVDWERYHNSLLGEFYLSDRLKLVSNLFHDFYEDTYIAYSDESYQNEAWRSLIENRTLGTHLNSEYIGGEKWRSDIGLRAEYKTYNRKGGPGYETNWIGNSQTLISFYQQCETDLYSELLSLTFGNSLISYTHSDLNSAHYYYEPQIGLFSNPAGMIISAAFSRSHQFPTMHQLFSHSSGNADLKPEQAQKYEIMLKHPIASPNVSGMIGTVLYYNHISDMIRRNALMYENVAQMTTQGVEFFLRFNLINDFTHDYEWTLLKADKQKSSLPLLDQPENKIKLSHQVKLTENIKLMHTSLWIGKRISLDRDDISHSLPSYWLHDIRFAFDIADTKLSVNIHNLLDSYYEPEFGYPGSGREVSASIQFPIH